ncbi:hypothetical protein C8R46DRAFT_1347841 [Mycena filopes]|nr:hypothetical protein C8R46DRAFT_1347841 [Mycena filopes]
MPSLKRAFTQVTSYRLGYTPQRPYPWRWVTPAALGVFLLISIFLTLVNIPLSAYEIVQQSTYRPNDTLPPLLFSKLDPFEPHVLTVGDTLGANSSIFNFTIVGAWDENLAPVASFSYYNNPFSDGCDVSNMTFTLNVTHATQEEEDFEDFGSILSVKGIIFPSMTSTLRYDLVLSHNPLQEIFTDLWLDLLAIIPSPSWNTSKLSASVVPCCDGDWTLLSSGTFLPTEPPCRTQVAQLVGSQWLIFVVDEFGPGENEGLNLNGPGSSLIFNQSGSLNLFGDTGLIDSLDEFLSQPSVNNAFQNVFQSLYHLARLELGVIVENQIFSSPAMFNASISNLYYPDAGPFLTANISRASTSNATLMKEWADIVHMFNTTDRVPVLSYLRPVPRLKPLGSALTSVFVSTFAMVSVLWTIFSLIAGVVAARSENSSAQGPAPSAVEDRLDTYGVDLAHTKLSVARMQLALKKRGLFEEDDEEVDLAASIACTSGEEERSTFLVHSKQSDFYSAV